MDDFIVASWDDEIKYVKKNQSQSELDDFDDKKIKIYKDKITDILYKKKNITLPEKKEQIRYITAININPIVFIEKILQKHKMIKHLIIVVYSINYIAANIINDFVNENLIEKMTIIISNIRNTAHDSKTQIVNNIFRENQKIDLFFVNSHAKIMSCQTIDDNYYHIEGSGNLGFNSRIEQYVIDNEKKLYEFTLEWIKEIKEYLKNKKELQF